MARNRHHSRGSEASEWPASQSVNVLLRPLNNRLNTLLTSRLRSNSLLGYRLRANSVPVLPHVDTLPSFKQSRETEEALPITPQTAPKIPLGLSLPHVEEDISASKPKIKSPDSSGFFSSIYNAAHHAANIMLSEDTHKHKHSHDKSTSFSTKLDQLLVPSKFRSSPSMLSKHSDDADSLHLGNNGEGHLLATESNGLHKTSSGALGLKMPLLPAISTSDVHFDLVRESPLNTLGMGDLLLSHFDAAAKPPMAAPTAKRPLLSPSQSQDSLALAAGDIKRAVSPGLVNRQLPATNQLVVTGLNDTKKIRRKSINNASGSVPLETTRTIRSDDGLEENQEHPPRIGSDTELDDSNDDLDHILDYDNISLASSKRNKDFHQVFKKISAKENLIDAFSCALSKDILVQGRMYLLEHCICFNSNILGWVTNLVIPLQEVIQIEKKSTAVLFPNGMIIRTLHQKYVFATFLSRDTTFNIITNVWHRVLLETSDGDAAKLAHYAIRKNRRRGESKSSADPSDYDIQSSADDLLGNSDDDLTEDGMDDETDDESDPKKPDEALKSHDSSSNSSKKDSNMDDLQSVSRVASRKETDDSSKNSGKSNTFKGLPCVGPLTHAPTELEYSKGANDTFIMEETFNAPVGVIYNILFGKDTLKYIKILETQKNFDILEVDITELSTKSRERHYTYTKPLGGPIGPKQTKCIIVDKLIEFQVEKYILVEEITSTPDVPSGNSFQVKTKIFLHWAKANSTHLYVVTQVEWSGKSWIKGAIEKGSIDGQKESMKYLVDVVNGMLNSGTDSGSKDKKKAKRKRSSASKRPETAASVEKKEEPSKSIIEQLKQLIATIGAIIPVSIPMVGVEEANLGKGIILLVGFYVILGFFKSLLFGSAESKSPRTAAGQKYFLVSTPDAIFGDEEARVASEVRLWDWLEARSNGKIHSAGRGFRDEDRVHLELAKKTKVHNFLRDYSNQEIEEIVRLTQMKLDRITDQLSL